MFGNLAARADYYYGRVWHHLGERRFFRQTRAVFSTAPAPCDPHASCEIHTMLGRSGLQPYLVAIKSFLRFVPSVRVLVLSDGTIGPDEAILLGRHVPGCRVVMPEEADARARSVLGEGSLLWKSRGIDASFRRLIDSELFASTPKRINMDSDIVTLRRPDEVLAWIESGTAPFQIADTLIEPRREDIDLSTAHVQAVFEAKLDELSQMLDLPSKYNRGSCAGFYGCRTELGLVPVERVIRACMALNLRLDEWGIEQSIVTYLLSTAGGTILDTRHYFNYWPRDAGRAADAAVVHFLGLHRYHRHVYAAQAATAIAALPIVDQ